MRRIFVFSRPYRFRLYLAIAFTIISSLVWLALPLGLRSLLDAVFEEGNRELLNLITWGLLALFVLQTVFGFWGRYYLEWIGERVVTDLRNLVYRHLNVLGFRFFFSQRVGDLTSRLTNDVSAVREAVTTA